MPVAKVINFNFASNEMRVFYKAELSDYEKQLLREEADKVKNEVDNGGFNTSDPFVSTVDVGAELPPAIAVVRIPNINMSATVYQGVSEAILDKAVGILPKTHLPYGGTSTNSVLVAHRGTHNADLFKNVDKLVQGDLILIDNNLNNETLAYRVRDFKTVLPDEGDKIVVEEGKDIITLVTCTPYMINSHRLLITAERDSSYVEPVPFTEIQPTSTTDVIIKELTSPYVIFTSLGVITVIGIMLVMKGRDKNEKNS